MHLCRIITIIILERKVLLLNKYARRNDLLLPAFFQGFYKNDYDLVKKYGGVLGVFEGHTPVVLVSDPELLRQVLVKDGHIIRDRRVGGNTLGPLEHGIINAKGDQWKSARALITPTFTTSKLKQARKKINCLPPTLLLLMDAYVTDNITSCLFGIETNSLDNGFKRAPLMEHLNNFQQTLVWNTALYNMFPLLTNYLAKKGLFISSKESCQYLINLLNSTIEQRKKQTEKRADFLQTMIDHEYDESSTTENFKSVSNNQKIVSYALEFFLNHDVPAILLSFFMYVMAIHPDIQDKVYNEIKAVVKEVT
ncbi:unnamed protein product [Didymodactylos carnosus]|uniref:Cytochrome P450 n=2 Tax=Didymodactylos carnosus TaxID=1234261 RepID=A0A814AW53_9BILA|nr:unnamed protein product [Didymodactylos carnosus]CAF3699905.1 unnamed protein product [Didymodactylos carnosus]